MCGIFGYVNSNLPRSIEEILKILLGGLEKVEYRGYDSAGLCIEPQQTSDADGATVPAPRPCVVRSVGNIGQLRAKVFSPTVLEALPPLTSTRRHHVGIAHTRWATHGEVCVRNCHPQQSNSGEFTAVHNGIVTNYATIKELLLQEGYHFNSETDTEVICVLAEYLYSKKGFHHFADLVLELSSLVEGAYALLLESIYFPGQVIATRKGSPLVIGIRQTDPEGRVVKLSSLDAPNPSWPLEIFFASDSNSFVEYTSRVVYLEDNDVVLYDQGALHFRNSADKEQMTLCREAEELETQLENLSKGKYPHFMLKEIHEQAESIVCSMRGRINFVTGAVRLGGFTEQRVQGILSSRRLIFIACGTSLNSCIAVRPLLEELIRVPVCMENASDFVDRAPRVARDDACFFISQSGETADTLMALKLCRDAGALCIGITNVVGSNISRLTDYGVHLNAGVEVGVASTKAYTSQVTVMVLVALLLSADSISLQQRRMEVVNGLATLSLTIQKALQVADEPMRQLATRLKDSRSLLVLGRGYDFATSMEAALKIKELSYVHTEGINSGELKHGPLALIDPTMPVLALATNDKHFLKCKAAVQQVNARKGCVTVFTTDADAELRMAAQDIILMPKTVDCLQCIVNVVFFQLLAYYMALLRGNNVDCPRNLAKSVTVQ